MIFFHILYKTFDNVFIFFEFFVIFIFVVIVLVHHLSYKWHVLYIKKTSNLVTIFLLCNKYCVYLRMIMN